MAEERVRYSAGIQRSKGLLELAAELYDTSLSYQTKRAGIGASQIDSRLGSRLSVRIDGGLGISLGVGSGFRQGLMRVAQKEVSLLWINPSVGLTMAYRGTGPFTEPQPLRAIAVFPSWDVVTFAVHESTGITSLEEIRERRYPLRVSTRENVTPPFDESATMFAVTSILAAAGFSLDDIKSWGGSIRTVPRPSHPDRGEAIVSGEVDAIFDEGILSWGQLALEHGFRILSIENALFERVKGTGYQLTMMTPDRFPGLREEVPAINFCGWPMIVHADMEDSVAYALCEAIEGRKDLIPTDNYKPLDLAQLCSDTDETPRGVPLHPGAERFYRERGYLHA